MSTYTYSPFYRFFFRYGNIPISFLLLYYIYLYAERLDENLLNLVPLLLYLVLLYFLNKHYITLYKIMPYKIETDEEKITASDFLFSAKKTVIYFRDISELRGGIFDGKLSGIMKVTDGPTKRVIGFSGKMRNVGQFQTEILSRVNRKLYDEVIERVGVKKKK